MADKPTWGQRLRAWVQQNHEQQPSLGAEIRAIGREAIKDVRNTVHESFFGRHEGLGEQGTPLNPTPQLVTQDLGNVHGFEQTLDYYASRGSQGQERQQEKGIER